MQATLPVFKGRLIGANRVAWMMGEAPKEISRAVFRGFIGIRNQYIGSARKKGNVSGLVRRRIERKKNWGGRISPTQNSATWTRQFSSLMKGAVAGDQHVLKTLSLHMGVLYNTKKPIHSAMEEMIEGGRIRATGRLMIVPMYANLQRVGVYLKTGRAGEALKRYERNGSMFVTHRGSKVLWYDRDLWEHGDRSNALMFVGVREIEISKKFDFYSQWPAFQQRANKIVERSIDRTVKILEAHR